MRASVMLMNLVKENLGGVGIVDGLNLVRKDLFSSIREVGVEMDCGGQRRNWVRLRVWKGGRLQGVGWDWKQWFWLRDSMDCVLQLSGILCHMCGTQSDLMKLRRLWEDDHS